MASSSGPTEILPDQGLVYSELKEQRPVLCQPKLLPIKSYSLERLELMERRLALDAKQRRDEAKAARNVAAWNTAPTAQQKQQATQQTASGSGDATTTPGADAQDL